MITKSRTSLLVLTITTLTSVACGSQSGTVAGPTDGGSNWQPPGNDASVPAVDGGKPSVDAGKPAADASKPPGNDAGTTSNDAAIVPFDAGTSPVSGAGIVTGLRGDPHFMIGLTGTDRGFGGVTAPLDIVYRYLVGAGAGDWTTWNTDSNGGGAYVGVITDQADKIKATPMFTVYQMAQNGDGNLADLTDAAFMTTYWANIKNLFTRLGTYGKPGIVQIEPDFFGYVLNSIAPDKAGSILVSGHLTQCSSLPNTPIGFAQCFLAVRNALAPKALLGLHVSNFGKSTAEANTFYTALGAPSFDLLTVDVLDRDSGCFEAQTSGDCQGRGGKTGWYWDETNATSPNFVEYETGLKAIATGLGRPILMWQVPLGVPSSTPGGKDHAYRDNRVHYIFSHVGEFVASGVIGAVFGAGADSQTETDGDNGQYAAAAANYEAHKVTVP